jgi:hypothetical protein
MKSSKIDVAELAGNLGYTISESELGDYETMLDKAVSAFELVEGMDGLSCTTHYPSNLAHKAQTISPYQISKPVLAKTSIYRKMMKIL